MALKDNIKRYRAMAGLTLANVANRIGVSKQTIQKYECGIISNVPSDKIEEMAKVFNCSPSELMGWTDSPSKFSEAKRSSEDESLLKDFHKLNRKGREAAQATIKGFTCLPEYTEAANEDVE